MVDGQECGSVMVDAFPAGTAVALGQGALSGRCAAPSSVGSELPDADSIS